MNEDCDHVGHALHRLGYGGGGEVGVASKLAQVVEEFLSRYHEFMRTPSPELTDEQLNHIHSLKETLTQHGVDPDELLQTAMQSKPAEATVHADGGSVSDLVTGQDTRPDYQSSLNKLKNWLQSHITGGGISGLSPQGADFVDRGVISIAKQAYGTDPEGHVVLGGSLKGHLPLALQNIGAIPYRLANLTDKLAAALPLPESIFPQEKPWAEQGPLMPASKQAAQNADTMTEKFKRTAPQAPATTFPQHLADNLDVVMPVPGVGGSGALSHLAGFAGLSGMKNYPRMLAEFDTFNSGIDTLMDHLTGKSAAPGESDPADLVHRAVPAHAGGGEVSALSKILMNRQRLEDALERLSSHLSRPDLDKGAREALQTQYTQGVAAHHDALDNPSPQTLQGLTQAVESFEEAAKPHQIGDLGDRPSAPFEQRKSPPSDAQQILFRTSPQLEHQQLQQSAPFVKAGQGVSRAALTPVESLKVTRTLDQPTVDDIADKIQEGKEMPPILIDEGGNVLDGNHRLEAARRLGIDHIPAMQVTSGEANAQ